MRKFKQGTIVLAKPTKIKKHFSSKFVGNGQYEIIVYDAENFEYINKEFDSLYSHEVVYPVLIIGGGKPRSSKGKKPVQRYIGNLLAPPNFELLKPNMVIPNVKFTGYWEANEDKLRYEFESNYFEEEGKAIVKHFFEEMPTKKDNYHCRYNIDQIHGMAYLGSPNIGKILTYPKGIDTNISERNKEILNNIKENDTIKIGGLEAKVWWKCEHYFSQTPAAGFEPACP